MVEPGAESRPLETRVDLRRVFFSFCFFCEDKHVPSPKAHQPKPMKTGSATRFFIPNYYCICASLSGCQVVRQMSRLDVSVVTG